MRESEYPIAFAAAADYTRESLVPALEQVVRQSGFAPDQVAGRTVLLKPNLLMKRRPEEATTTHPLVVEAAARLLLDWGAARVTIADSPGGPYTKPLLHGIYETCGMTEAARQSGAALNEDTGFTTLRREENRLVREFSIINPVAEADLLVSVCKLKTHSMTTLSGGVKNLFGCIPGLQKPELHLRFPDKSDFGEMLVDLALTVQPALTLVDAVVGMEGDGPSGGSPRKLGFLAACRDPFLLDLCLAQIIGVSPASVPTIAAAQKRGLCPESATGLSMAGAVQFAQPVPGFVPPHAKSVDFLSHTPPAAASGGEPPVGPLHPPAGDSPGGLHRLRPLCRKLPGPHHHPGTAQSAHPLRPVHPLLLLPRDVPGARHRDPPHPLL